MTCKFYLDLDTQKNTHINESQKLREKYAIPTPNFNLLSLFIDQILYEEFEQFESVLTKMFTNEPNSQVRLLFINKVQDFYKVA